MLCLGKTKCRFLVVSVILACGTALSAEPPARDAQKEAEESAESRFLRVKRNQYGRPVALETAIVRYVPASREGDLAVDLIACVHLGERSYYQKLNKRFEQYDVVLYELVAPKGTRVPPGGARDEGNPLVALQQMTESVLELESQVEQIDYQRENFVHADMSPAEMAEAVRQRGDDGLTLLLGVTADFLRQQNRKKLERQKNPRPPSPAESFDPLLLLFDTNRAATLKQMLAEEFEQMGTADLGGTLNTILVEDRNKAAMRVFQIELTKGKKRIAILYGAGHMADFEKRLVGEFGLKRDRVEWLPAWEL